MQASLAAMPATLYEQGLVLGQKWRTAEEEAHGAIAQDLQGQLRVMEQQWRDEVQARERQGKEAEASHRRVVQLEGQLGAAEEGARTGKDLQEQLRVMEQQWGDKRRQEKESLASLQLLRAEFEVQQDAHRSSAEEAEASRRRVAQLEGQLARAEARLQRGAPSILPTPGALQLSRSAAGSEAPDGLVHTDEIDAIREGTKTHQSDYDALSNRVESMLKERANRAKTRATCTVESVLKEKLVK